MTFTNPGGSPRGLTSAFPSTSTVPSATKGAWAMKARQCWSSEGRTLRTTSSCGAPMTARTSSADRARSDVVSVISQLLLALSRAGCFVKLRSCKASPPSAEIGEQLRSSCRRCRRAVPSGNRGRLEDRDRAARDDRLPPLRGAARQESALPLEPLYADEGVPRRRAADRGAGGGREALRHPRERVPRR